MVYMWEKKREPCNSVNSLTKICTSPDKLLIITHLYSCSYKISYGNKMTEQGLSVNVYNNFQ